MYVANYIMFVCSYYAKIQFLEEELKQFSKKCFLLEDACDVLYVVCVFCGFVCRVLRNGAIVSKTMCKHFEKIVK